MNTTPSAAAHFYSNSCKHGHCYELYLQLLQWESSSSSNSSVIFDGWASYDRSELVDRSWGNGGSLWQTSISSSEFTSWLIEVNSYSGSLSMRDVLSNLEQKYVQPLYMFYGVHTAIAFGNGCLGVVDCLKCTIYVSLPRTNIHLNSWRFWSNNQCRIRLQKIRDVCHDWTSFLLESSN